MSGDEALHDLQVLRGAWETMSTLRTFEEQTERLYFDGRIRGSVHLGIGQEAVAVGARIGSRQGDLVLPTYRGHNYALAWGVPLAAAFAELLGRETGCNRGRGGSKHFADAARGVFPGNALVAAALPIACGTALKARLDGDAQVSIVPFGDGATNQAVFHEALNLAVIWKLPVIFLCENNLYSEMTPVAAMTPFNDMADRGRAYGMPAHIVDGMDVEAVASAVGNAAQRARAGDGPTFLEAKTYRFCGHMPGDTESYRERDEVASWRERDPIRLTRNDLLRRGVPETDLSAIERKLAEAVPSGSSIR